MHRATRRLFTDAHGHAVVRAGGAVATAKPSWWTTPMVVPPSEMELALFQPKEQKQAPTRYQKHPWFRNFGQNRRGIVDAPTRGEFFRFRAFWNVMKEKSRELGVKGSLLWFVLMMRRQREAYYEKGYDSKLVGVDELGNKFWESTYTTAIQSRWVEYPDRACYDTDATVVSPDWYQWLHGMPAPQGHQISQRFPDCFGKGLTSDYWYRIRWTELLYDGDRKHFPRGHPHPANSKFDDFVLRSRRVSRRKGFMEFDPFVLPAERLKKRDKWTNNPMQDRHHTWPATKLPF